MQNSRKPTIFVVLMIMAVLVWVRKDASSPDTSSASTSAIPDQVATANATPARKRTEFVDWGRSPFGRPQREENAGGDCDVKLRAIMCCGEEVRAALNESIVRVGDRIAGKTVKRIEYNRVILTDGTRDYILEFQK